MRCICCGKEFEPTELQENLKILYGRGDGKTVLHLCKMMEYRTCSPKCAAHVSKLVYDYFYGKLEDSENSEN